ncbi:MAG: TIM barrel protein [Gammaproteobacteria bacterium]|jgi:hydroxypyruvate isomerase|nr:TIM barrel protein [Gammaproteobacteria bacterium]
MPRFSANISTLFREFPLLERIGQAAAAGFDAIEVQFPYNEDPEQFKAELELHRLPLVLMNFPVGDLMQGGQGLAAVPGRETEFDAALTEARKFAEILKPEAMNLLAGRPDSTQDSLLCDAAFRTSLRKAFALTSQLGIRLLTEPVNTIDLPGFYLCGSQQALDLIATMPDIELLLQYDLYHMQMMEADLMKRLPAIIEWIGHIQFSDVPGRTEPGRGSIDFAACFDLIDRLGYSGYVGAEYFPSVNTESSLDWLIPYRQEP